MNKCIKIFVLAVLMVVGAVALIGVGQDWAIKDNYTAETERGGEEVVAYNTISEKVDEDAALGIQNVMKWFVGGVFVAIFLITGFVLLFLTPKITFFFGYRTSLSMANEENWRIANKTAGLLLLVFGTILLMLLLTLGRGGKFATFMTTFFSVLGAGLVCMIVVPSIVMRRDIARRKRLESERDSDNIEGANDDNSINESSTDDMAGSDCMGGNNIDNTENGGVISVDAAENGGEKNNDKTDKLE